MDQYVSWANKLYNTNLSHDDFYNNPSIQQWYKNHIRIIVNRKNTLNGKIYKEDPTIFAWELANEPRCSSDRSGNILNEWLAEMSSFIKRIDPNHLITTGLEGFYNKKRGAWWDNGSQGVDFIRNHQISTIDFTTVHVWPDHWNMDYNETMKWIKKHIEDSHDIIFKPIIYRRIWCS